MRGWFKKHTTKIIIFFVNVGLVGSATYAIKQKDEERRIIKNEEDKRLESAAIENQKNQGTFEEILESQPVAPETNPENFQDVQAEASAAPPEPVAPVPAATSAPVPAPVAAPAPAPSQSAVSKESSGSSSSSSSSSSKKKSSSKSSSSSSSKSSSPSSSKKTKTS